MSSKNARISFRIPKEQKDMMKRAVNLTGRASLSDFIRASAEEKARETLKDYEVMELSKKDSKIFAKALLNDTEPGEELKEAARRYKKNSSK